MNDTFGMKLVFEQSAVGFGTLRSKLFYISAVCLRHNQYGVWCENF